MENFLHNFDKLATGAIDRLPAAVATLLIGMVVVEILVRVVTKLLNFAVHRVALRNITRTLLRVFLYVTLLLAVMQALGLQNVIVALTGSSVIIAVLISSGVSPLVTDLFAGLFLSGDREFRPGATVRAGDKGAEGVIQTMDARKTYIKDKTGKIHVLPNALVEKSEWVILKKSPDSTGPRKKRKLRKSA